VSAADFDWNNRDVLVLDRQDAVAVYSGQNGHLCIRQQSQDFDDKDHIVLVDPRRALDLCKAILIEVGLYDAAQAMVGATRAPVPTRSQPASAGATRSRRYREKHKGRDASRVTESVTPTVTENVTSRDERDAPLLRSIEGGVRAAS
jgi:hypothetical protein